VLVEGNPKDTKVMHELAEYYLSQNRADKAVEVYNRIVALNPQDLVALKRSKDASAQASMNSGGWDKAQSYRDLMKDKDEAVSLEQKSRVVRDLDMIDAQLAELTPQWEVDQSNVELSRRVAKLWDERQEQKGDDESLSGAIWYYGHVNTVINGSDPAILRKLSDLQLRQTDMQIKQYEEFFATGGDEHEEAAQYREALETLKKQRAETMISESRQRVERNPTDLQLRFELGERLLAAGNFAEAIP
jgi:tetratricopeptide (TPR) repeat protein